VRITAKLIGGTNEQTLWADSYERDLGDVLALQGEVASRIAREINVTLTPQEAAGLATTRKVDPAVHRLFLLGRYHVNRPSEGDLRKAIEYFEQVIAKDARHAEAHLGLAEGYVALAATSIARPRDVIPKAKEAAAVAVKIDESLADVHALLGYIHLFYDWDGPAAEREFQRALRLNPSLAMAHMYYAGYHLATGKRDEAVPEIRRALELDPLSLVTQAYGTMFLLFAGRNDEAIEQARVALELEPKFGPAITVRGLAYAEQGRFGEAVKSLEEALGVDRSWRTMLFGAHVHAVAGHPDEARKLIAQVEKIGGAQYVCPYEVACAYISLHENDEAYRWFKKGIHERADCMAWLGVEPWVEPFRKDPRYSELLREIGLAAQRQTPK
jgi:tetratricopeptide (TPR) repeat protein